MDNVSRKVWLGVVAVAALVGVATALEELEGQDQRRDRAAEAAGEEVDPEDGRVPDRVQAHQQVERRKGDGAREDQHAGRRQAFHPVGQGRVAALILLGLGGLAARALVRA